MLITQSQNDKEAPLKIEVSAHSMQQMEAAGSIKPARLKMHMLSPLNDAPSSRMRTVLLDPGSTQTILQVEAIQSTTTPTTLRVLSNEAKIANLIPQSLLMLPLDPPQDHMLLPGLKYEVITMVQQSSDEHNRCTSETKQIEDQ